MFDIPKTATGLHHFANNHQEAFQNAALMLGGRRWLRRVQDLLEFLRAGHPLNRSTLRDAGALLELLSSSEKRDVASADAECRKTCDPVAAYATEVEMLKITFAEALSPMEVDGNTPQTFAYGRDQDD